jgi:tRNA A-37 threonylcarbamoyl transferase component Bud32
LATDGAVIRGKYRVLGKLGAGGVRVEDIDQADDGRPFMVMEFIEGESPKDVIQRQRHSLDAILGPAGAISAVKSQCLHAPTWAMVCC